jgi:hypothetical protein
MAKIGQNPWGRIWEILVRHIVQATETNPSGSREMTGGIKSTVLVELQALARHMFRIIVHKQCLISRVKIFS